jgi:hypothetical protein
MKDQACGSPCAVSGAGQLAVDEYRVPMRYNQREGTRLYGAGAAGIEIVKGAAAVEYAADWNFRAAFCWWSQREAPHSGSGALALLTRLP